ncbi:MAG: metallophosphoesterase [Phycisphaerales bacterium]|jgi:3',5'-cyclic AMP phosphodiesterase CpdA
MRNQPTDASSNASEVSISKVSLSRRALLGAGTALGLASLLRTPAALAAPLRSGRNRVLRFAHPTDTHVEPELRGALGMRTAFEHMMSQKPELVITGGDLPFDTGSTPEGRSRELWTLFNTIVKDTVGSTVPIYHTIGNHDVFGRDKKKAKATGKEPFYGKQWFLDNFQYTRTFQSFEKGGWKFIILDSINLLPDGSGEFHCKLGDEQMAWFKNELTTTPATTPIVVISHAPIISVANFFDQDDSEWETDGPDLKVPSSRMHVDCRDIHALFDKHPNVKLCLAGHFHQSDRCQFHGVTHITNGAVCGAKWKGPKRGTPEGYGLIDLFDDGTFEHQYMTYGWKAEGK